VSKINYNKSFSLKTLPCCRAVTATGHTSSSLLQNITLVKIPSRGKISVEKMSVIIAFDEEVSMVLAPGYTDGNIRAVKSNTIVSMIKVKVRIPIYHAGFLLHSIAIPLPYCKNDMPLHTFPLISF